MIPSQKTLYEGLNDDEGIAAVINELLHRLSADTQWARFWQHWGEDRL